MPFDEPGWWYGADDRRARWLAPAARLWSRVAIARHARQHPYRSRLPVICIGNFTAGGTGKTPLALHIAALLKNAGENPVLLTRGYGGRLAGPLWVEPGRQDVSDVGDEPLLLARTAPVMLARDRRRGALAIEAEENVGGAGPASVIVMDDGLQNPALAKDLAIALVDGMRGVGNGLVMPAGPLRAPLEFQLGLVDAIVVTRRPGAADPVTQAAQATTPTTPPTTTATDAQPGLSGQSAKSGKSGEPAEPPASAMDPTTAPIAGPRVLASLRQGFPGPVLSAAQSPVGDTSWLAGAPVFAYAGIGNPGRFFDLLRELGANLVGAVAFRDHHAFTEADAARMLDKAQQASAILVTTEKDLARIAGPMHPATRGEQRSASAPPLARLAAESRMLPIRLAFDAADAARLADLVLSAAHTGGYRRGLRRS